MIVELGGIQGAIDKLTSETKESPVSSFTYNNVQYFVYKNGTVISENKEVIVTEGGQQAAVDKIVPTTLNYNNETYYIYKDGHSTDVDGNTIIEKGGKDALIEYLNA